MTKEHFTYSYRLRKDHIKAVDKLARKLKDSKSGVVRRAIEELADKHIKDWGIYVA